MKTVWKRLPVLFMVLLGLTLPASAQMAAGGAGALSDYTWPRTIETPEAKIVIYQPQLEDFTENRLQCRFAASVQGQDQAESEFGAVWVAARMETQRDERTVHLVAIENVRSRFPNATEENQAWFADVLRKEIPKWDMVLSIDQLVAGLEVEQERIKTEQALNNDPPEILHVNRQAVLVAVDGQPILEPIEGTQLMAVVNTPFPMVFRKADKTYYLIGKEAWYRSREISGQWEETNDPPADVAVLEREAADDEDAESAVTAGMLVFGATEPTELLSIDGNPKFVPFPGNNLLYVMNTDNDLLFELDEGQYYLLLSGRWYRTRTLDGPWSYVAPEQLPDAFNDISADSAKGDLRASVPGTEEALDAVLEAQIPETAVIRRSEATLAVAYDGAPEFALIEGTGIDYALNTATPVIRVNGTYYAVDNGVWFVGPAATGPWVVADAVPAEVQDIPPSSPVNNIKYVYIYDSTPEVVYVGYTPGYLGCYVHHGVIVYGTGYRYRPWYRTYYYPRHSTYGFSVRYSSYHGWSFGFSYYYGPFTFYFGHAWGPPRYGGWWGPPRYRPPCYRPPSYRPKPPQTPGNRPPVNRPPVVKPPSDGKPVQLPAGQGPGGRPSSDNLYGNRLDKAAGGSVRPATMDRKDNEQVGQPAQLPNNVYTDREGNVYRKGEDGWEQRKDGQWQRPAESQPETPSQLPSRPSDGSAQTPSQLPSGSAQRPAQQPSQPSGGSGQQPSQLPSGPAQTPSQLPSDSVQRPTQQPSQPSGGSGQQPSQLPSSPAQTPSQLPSGSLQRPAQQPSQPSGGSAQQPSQLPSSPAQTPSQLPSGSLQRPAQQPSQPSGGSAQQPSQLLSTPAQTPAQRPAQQPESGSSTRQSQGSQQSGIFNRQSQSSQQSGQQGSSTQQSQGSQQGSSNRQSLDSQQQSRDRGNQRTSQFLENQERSSGGRNNQR